MEFSKNYYIAPQADVSRAKTRKVLCQSNLEGTNTEGFTLGSYNYGDDNWEDW